MLIVRDLVKRFDGFCAVNGAWLEVAAGQAVAVIGPNGAGKTTLFHLISGQLAPDAGSIEFNGRAIAGLPAHRVCRLGIGRSYQVATVFDRQTVADNVRLAVLAHQGTTWRMWRPARHMAEEETRAILAQVGLADKAGRPAGALSHGDRKVLEIAIALAARPRLLVLDEPTAGMSAEETAVTLALMKRLKNQMGVTLLFCEHDMQLVFAVADQIMVMHQGRTLVQAAPAQVRSHPQVQEAYLGTEASCSR